MKSLAKFLILGATLIFTVAAAGTAWSQDPMAIIKDRQDLMKRQGKDLGAIRAYGAGKGDLATAEAAAADLTQTTRKIPSLFPPKTGMVEFPGKTGAKPAIWMEWDKFLAAQTNTLAKADALLAALKRDGKAAATAGPTDLWDNGCQGCHKAYRAEI